MLAGKPLKRQPAKPAPRRKARRLPVEEWHRQLAELARYEAESYWRFGIPPSRICQCSDHPDAFRCRRREHRQVWLDTKGRPWCPCWCHDPWARPDVPPDPTRPPLPADPPAE